MAPAHALVRYIDGHVLKHHATLLGCAGIDLNPRFHDCRAYEFTDEVAIFDLLEVPLLHGWLVDPQVLALCSVSFQMLSIFQTCRTSSSSIAHVGE